MNEAAVTRISCRNHSQWGTPGSEDSQFLFPIGTLPAGEQTRITFETTVNDDASGIAICNQGQITASNHDQLRTGDPDTADPADPNSLFPVLSISATIPIPGNR